MKIRKTFIFLLLALFLTIGTASGWNVWMSGSIGISGWIDDFTGYDGEPLDEHTPTGTPGMGGSSIVSATGTITGGSWGADPTLGAEAASAGSCTSVTGEEDDTDGWTDSGMATFESATIAGPIGAYSLHFIANGNGDHVDMTDAMTTVIGTMYVAEFNYKLDNPGGTTGFYILAGTAQGDSSYFSEKETSGEWLNLTHPFIATTTTTYFTFMEAGSDDCNVFVDTVSLKALTIAEAMVLQDVGVADIVVQANLTGFAGIIARYGDDDNFLLAFVNPNDTLAYLYKRVAGTWTELINEAIGGYAAGKELKIICSGDDLDLEYDGGAVGATQTEAVLAANTTHGGFSISTTNLVDDLEIWNTAETVLLQEDADWTAGSGTYTTSSARHTEVPGAEKAPANTCTSVTGEVDVTTGWTNDGMGTFASDTLGTEPTGTHSLHFIANSNLDQVQTGALTTVIGTFYIVEIQYITINGDADTTLGLWIGTSQGGNQIISESGFASTSWATITRYFKATSTSTYITFPEGGVGDDLEAYVDTVSLKSLTLSSIVTLSNLGITSGVYELTPGTVAVGELCGIVALANDSVASTDGLFALIDRTSGNLEVFKRVAGTDTSLISTSITYAASAKLYIVYDKTQGGITAFYNNAIVGTFQALTDASVINNTYSGYLTTGSASVTALNYRPLGFGAELVNKGDMETTADPDINTQSWASSNDCAPYSQSVTQAHGGTKSILMLGDAISVDMSNYISDGSNCGLTSGELYKKSIWVYVPSGQGTTAALLRYIPVAAAVTIDTTAVEDAWVELSGYFIDTDTAHIVNTEVTAANVDGVSVYWDDLSLKHVQ